MLSNNLGSENTFHADTGGHYIQVRLYAYMQLYLRDFVIIPASNVLKVKVHVITENSRHGKRAGILCIGEVTDRVHSFFVSLHVFCDAKHARVHE